MAVRNQREGKKYHPKSVHKDCNLCYLLEDSAGAWGSKARHPVLDT